MAASSGEGASGFRGMAVTAVPKVARGIAKRIIVSQALIAGSRSGVLC
jgi:hypothetical protein